jgi:hypothetical protein
MAFYNNSFAQPKLQLQTEPHDFGTMKEDGGRKTLILFLLNSGDSVLLVTTRAVPFMWLYDP